MAFLGISCLAALVAGGTYGWKVAAMVAIVGINGRWVVWVLVAG